MKDAKEDSSLKPTTPSSTDMTESYKSQPSENNQTFEIRGHHLPLFTAFLRDGISPEKFAKLSVANYKTDLEKSRRLLCEKSDYTENDPMDHAANIAYYKDVFGETDESIEVFEKNFSEVFKTFLDLPAETPILLTAGKPDKLCGSCTGRGEHCSLRDQTEFGGGHDNVAGDYRLIDKFLKVSEEKFLTRPYEHRQQNVSFDDSPTRELSMYEIPSKEFKETLQHVINKTKAASSS